MKNLVEDCEERERGMEKTVCATSFSRTRVCAEKIRDKGKMGILILKYF